MNNLNFITQELKHNKEVFLNLFRNTSKEQFSWKQTPDSWSLLEILCHLYDEEREDFRARLTSVLQNPASAFASINPTGWVKERNYQQQDFQEMLKKFTDEREQSVAWLKTLDPSTGSGLKTSAWENTHVHPKLGPMSARFILANWLAHDYLHIRQIIKVKYHYLKQLSGESLSYAGDW